MKHYIPHPGQIEIHLGGSPEFSRYSKKVKALGGKYTECRGYSYTRFVDLPFTDEGRELANRLVALFGKPKTTIIVRGIPRDFRGRYIHAPVIVHYIDKTSADPCQDLLDSYEAAFLRDFPDAVNPEPVVAPAPKPADDDDDEQSLVPLTKSQARIVLAALERRVKELDSLGGPEADSLAAETREIYQSIDKQVYAF